MTQEYIIENTITIVIKIEVDGEFLSNMTREELLPENMRDDLSYVKMPWNEAEALTIECSTIQYITVLCCAMQ